MSHFLVWDPVDEPQPNGSERRNTVEAFCPEAAAETYARRLHAHGDYFDQAELIVKAPNGVLTRWLVEVELLPSFSAASIPACRVCGCTEDDDCEDGCSWAETDLCSQCVEAP